VLSVVYMSRANQGFDDAALATMLDDARLRNDALGVSGLLLHKDGRFMQVLEGPEHSVQNRLDAIMLDQRHSEVQSLVREDIDQRRFDGWSMAYRPVDQRTVAGNDGFSRFLSGGGSASSDGAFAFDRSSAAWLLRWFRDHRLDDAAVV
jgi:hypothetical protein